MVDRPKPLGMLQRLLERAYRRLGPRYPRTSLIVVLQVGYVVAFFSFLIMALYIHMSLGQFFLLLAVELAIWVVDAAIALRFALPRIEPATRWLAGEREEQQRFAKQKQDRAGIAPG